MENSITRPGETIKRKRNRRISTKAAIFPSARYCFGKGDKNSIEYFGNGCSGTSSFNPYFYK